MQHDVPSPTGSLRRGSSRSTARRATTGAWLPLLVLVAAACGDEDTAAPATTAAPAASVADPTTPPSSTTAPTTASPAVAPGTTPATDAPTTPPSTTVPVPAAAVPDDAEQALADAGSAVAEVDELAGELLVVLDTLAAGQSATADDVADIASSLEALETTATAALELIEAAAGRFAIVEQQLGEVTLALDGLLAEIDAVRPGVDEWLADGGAPTDTVSTALGGVERAIDELSATVRDRPGRDDGEPTLPELERPEVTVPKDRLPDRSIPEDGMTGADT